MGISTRLDKAALSAALDRTYEGTKGSKALALSCYLLVLEEPGRMLVESTDLEVSFSDVCPVLETDAFGRVLVPARSFRDIVKKLPGDDVELLVLENHRLEIRSGEGLFRLAGYDPADFPTIAEPDGESFKVWAADLQGLAEAVGHAMCRDEIKTNILGVRCQWVPDSSGGVLLAVTTDGHRVALASKRLDDPAPQFSGGVTIPRKGVEAIDRLEGPLGVSLTSGALHVQQGDFRVAIRLLEGEFPDVRKVIPDHYSSILSVNAEEFAAAVDRVRLLASNHEVLIELDGSTMILKAESERGEGLDAVAVSCDSPGLEIRLDARYVLDAVKSFGEGEIFIKYQDGSSSIVLLPADLSGFDERVLVVTPRYLRREEV